MSKENRSFGPLYLEASRERRLDAFARLRHWFREKHGDSGRYPFMTIEPWFEECQPHWPRGPFTIPMQEIFYNSELNYDATCLLIINRLGAITQTVNTEESHNQPAKPENPEYVRRSKLWSENHEGLHDALQETEIVGLEGSEEDGMKFLVYRTAVIPQNILGQFLDTALQPDPRTDTFRSFRPFSYLLTDTGSLAIETFGPRATRSGAIAELPESHVLGMSEEAMRSAWEEMVLPLTTTRSMIATHSFIILDEHTAEPANETVKIIQPAPEGGYNSARVSFALLNKGVLKAFEMCFLHVDMLKLADDDVLREDVYGVDA